MYGTMFHMQVKEGMVDRVVELQERWERELKPSIEGAIGGLILKADSDQNRVVGMAVFRDRESYRANLNNPEQDRWFQELRQCLTSDPEWTDGEYLFVEGMGGQLAQAA